MTGALVVFCTCASESEALQLAKASVEARLAACVNVLPGVRSLYRWQEKIETADEVLLVLKTTAETFPALRDHIAALHSYDTPEIVALPVVDGAPKYLAWLSAQTAK